MLDVLKKYFGYDFFRPLQREIIEHCVAGKDSLVLMPTGGGKSLCYQMPALLFSNMTLVVSPLIALMKDQVDALRANGVEAAYLNSSLSAQEMADVERRATEGRLKLLYLAPERIAMPRTQEWLKTLKVDLFAIDEAHCISEWGHDFRPEYRHLHLLRRLFPDIPLIALTATANLRVKEDIVKQLGLEHGRLFQSSFNRANLFYQVVPKKQALERLVGELRKRSGQSVIIYCFSRKGTEKIAADLRVNGVQALAYHAGLTPSERSRVQERFIRDETQVIVATIAFGMGIDKPDVRLVVHMDLPKSIEGYYQETGRAGRDGLPSDCLLFFSKGDCFKQEFFIREMNTQKEQYQARMQLQEMVRYGELTTCRRRFLLEYFGEASESVVCGACDVCAPRMMVDDFEPSARQDFDQSLFDELRQTRRRLADEKGVPPYMVFGDKTLQEMARVYPQTKERMAGIFGVGKEKLAKYGEIFLQTVRAYAEPRGYLEMIVAAVPSQKRSFHIKKEVTDTVMQSVQLFQEKKNLEAVAEARQLKVGTILQHLEEALTHGVRVDVSCLVFSSQARFDVIASAFKQSRGFSLTPVRERLGDAYSWDELKLARLLMRARDLSTVPSQDDQPF